MQCLVMETRANSYACTHNTRVMMTIAKNNVKNTYLTTVRPDSCTAETAEVYFQVAPYRTKSRHVWISREYRRTSGLGVKGQSVQKLFLVQWLSTVVQPL